MICNKKRSVVYFFFFLFGCIAFQSQAKDKIEKGFERLAVYDYFQARIYFSDAIKKQPIPAFYGLSIITSRNDNPFYNLDSARIFILHADSAFNLLPAKEKTELFQKYHITGENLEVRKDSIAIFAFKKAKENEDLSKWNYFIEHYNFSKLRDSAVSERNRYTYSLARNQNTSKAYKDFLEKYPSALQTVEAKRHYEESLFAESTSHQTESEYASFIKSYPESSFKAVAEDSLYSIATISKTLDAYYGFIKKYPDNKNTSKAWMKLYNRYLETHGATSFEDFLQTYPDFPYRNRVAEDYKLTNINLLPFRTAGKWGFVDSDGKKMIDAQFDEVGNFSEGLASVAKAEKYGYINKAGKKVIDFIFDDAEAFDSISGLAIVKLNGKGVLINRDGEPLFDSKFDEINYPHENRVLFLQTGKYGYSDLGGHVIVQAQFETASDFSGGIALVTIADKMGVIDPNGDWLIKPNYSFLEMEKNGLIKAQLDQKYGLLNKFGELILPLEYDAIGNFSNHLALVAKDGKAGYINDSAVLAIPLLYDFDNQFYFKNEFKNSLAQIKLKNKSGLIDTNGMKIIPTVYDDLRFTNDSLPIAVRKKGKWGYINNANKTVIPFKYDDALEFIGNYARVKLKNQYGLIDLNGKTIIPFSYEYIYPLSEQVAIVKKTGQYGLVTTGNEVLVPVNYDKYDFADPPNQDKPDLIRLEKDEKISYYSIWKRAWIWQE